MDLFKLLLTLHVLGGGTSLLLGSYILAVKKGDKKHVVLGRIYFYALLIAALLALPMSYLHPNYFLFIVGVFTCYMLISGKRYQSKKSVSDVTSVDWILTIVMLIFALAFIGFGTYIIINGNSFGIVFMVFGLISVFFVYQDNINFKGKSLIKNFGLTTHLQRMIGSYIGSATAFLVVNNKILPGVVAWLLPTIITVPLIVIWTRKYKISSTGNKVNKD